MQIATDYKKTFRVLKSLPCDIFLGAHGSYFDLESKYARFPENPRGAFVDSEGYRKFVTDREQVFESELARQRASMAR